MVRKVLFNHFFRQFSCCHTKEPPCPKVSAPISLLYLRKLCKYLVRCPPFYHPHNVRGWNIGGRWYQDMDMVFAHNTPQNLYLESFTNLADKFPDTKCQIALQQMVAIFRDPHKMVLNFILGMASLSIIHPNVIIQLLAESYPSKDGGLNLFWRTN